MTAPGWLVAGCCVFWLLVCGKDAWGCYGHQDWIGVGVQGAGTLVALWCAYTAFRGLP